MKYVLLAVAAIVLFPTVAPAHDGHAHPHDHVETPAESTPWLKPNVPSPRAENGAAPQEPKGVTGSGKYTFRHYPIEVPAEMAKHLKGAHGGFARDPEADGGDGSTYFSLKNVGLMRLAPDLSGIEIIGGDAAFTGVNLHNTCLFREGGETYLALPSDEAQKAFLTTTSGTLLRTFPNPYSAGKKAFRVCDLEYIDGRLFAPNGYADNVCFTTNPFMASPNDPWVGAWDAFRFGGKGKEHGKFGTAHGITIVPNTNVFTIADRANSRLETYTPAGRYVGGLQLPAGCLPCDVDFHEDLMLVGCLRGPKNSTPAPIYILEKGNLVAELNIGRDLGLPGFTHIHNAAFRVITQADGTRKLFVLAYAWNPGNFAILEQVMP